MYILNHDSEQWATEKIQVLGFSSQQNIVFIKIQDFSTQQMSQEGHGGKQNKVYQSQVKTTTQNQRKTPHQSRGYVMSHWALTKQEATPPTTTSTDHQIHRGQQRVMHRHDKPTAALPPSPEVSKRGTGDASPGP